MGRRADLRGRAEGASRFVVVGALGLAMLTGLPGVGLAVPPPPPNPSDGEINSGKADVAAKAGEVGKLTNQLAQAEQRLSQLQDDVELKLEQANKAFVDMQSAQDEATQAEQDAEGARKESDAASAQIDKVRKDLDVFVAQSYEQGSTVGSISAYIGSSDPKDLLARAQLLNAVGGSQLKALDEMRRAQTDKANKDSSARKALQIAQDKQDAAQRAKSKADSAKSTAEQAQTVQAGQNSVLVADKNTVEQKLYDAQSKVNGLQGQRQRYQDWLAQKQKEDEDRARQAALAAGAKGNGPVSDPPPAGPAGSSVEAVIARAMAQLGRPYAWGGGTSSGPSRGMRDGGIADRYGDYNKIGFDCSGLMIYAFAGVRALPHYSGYQYIAGRQVPVSQMRRGDMLFWGGFGGIHHVALYLGGGQMLEAPYSGSQVRVAAVRYGGIMPYATRLIG